MARQIQHRLREIREAAGLSIDDLAAKVGTSRQQVSRHERGERRLTIQWMQRYAIALEIAPADLLVTPPMADTQELEPADLSGLGELGQALAAKGLAIYRVVHSRIPDAGIAAGTVITVDTRLAAIAAARLGDAIVVRGENGLMLRQFLPPSLVVTNEPGPGNLAHRLDDRTIDLEIVGVVVRDRP